MGRQIRFFMVGNDEKKFIEMVVGLGDRFVDEKGNLVIVDTLVDVFRKNKLNQVGPPHYFIVSPESKIIQDEDRFIDQIRSDVIEFRGCYSIGQSMLREGRVWAEFSYYGESDELIKKEKWFERKFNKYKNWIKKNLRISVDKDSYIGEEAYKLYKEMGYKMMNGPNVAIEFE